MTLGDLFEEHYKYQKDKVKETTLTNYGKKVKHFDSLRDIKLDKINIHDIENSIDNLVTRTQELSEQLENTPKTVDYSRQEELALFLQVI